MFTKILSSFCLMIVFIGCSDSTESQIDNLFRTYHGDVPGAAVMVIYKGAIHFEKYYGLANIEDKSPVTRNTNFRLASATKQFTAMSILQLMEAGHLDFNTKLKTIFPELPAYADSINYGQLLHHTSGLIDYESLIPESATVPVRDADILTLLMAQDSTYFRPGTNYSYSNGGYALLALTVERLSEMSFPQYLENKIFEPVGMRGSIAYVNGLNTIQNRAFGYHVQNNTTRFSDQSMTSSVLGDGGIYSSTADLYKWDQILYTNQLLSQASMDSAFTPWLESYGCGWRIEDYKGLKRISHTGGTCGFRTVIQRFPEQEFSVIVLTNRRDPGVQYLAEAITDIVLDLRNDTPIE